MRVRAWGLNHADRSPILGVRLVTSAGCIVPSIGLGRVYNLAAPRRRLTTHVEIKDSEQNLLNMRRGGSSSLHLPAQMWHLWHCRDIHKLVDEIPVIVLTLQAGRFEIFS